METKEVFISYKSEEFDEALWVKNTLEASGISCWMAPMCITGGASYASEIPAAINNCKAFVLILSSTVQKSKWVPRELDQAINANKVILPFMLEECELNDEFSFYLSNVQRYTAYLDRDESVKKMIKEIRELIAKAKREEKEKKAAQEEKERQEKQRLEEFEKAQEESLKEEKLVEAAEPPKKKKEEKPKKTSAPKTKKKRSAVTVLAAIALIFVLIIGGSIIYNASQTVVIAGEKFKKSDYSINLSEKEITEEDIKNISKFKDLGAIRISDSTFKTSYLTEFANHDLYHLEIKNCNLTDGQLNSIDFKKITGLDVIDLSGNKNLTDVSAIVPSASELSELNISDTAVKSIEFLSSFEKLEILSISGLGVTSIEHLNKLIYLEEIYADNNALTSIAGLENTTILEEVSFAGNLLEDVSILANSAETLRTVILNTNKLSDLSALSVCKNLTTFQADGNSLTSLEFLSDCTSLSHVSVSQNAITGVEGLKGILKHVNLSGNKLTSIDGLSFDENGSIYADLSDNELTSLSLPEGCHFGTLNLRGNAFSDNSFYEGIKGYTIEIDYFEALSSELLKELGFGTINLYGCPDNRKVEFEKASYSINLL